MVDPLSCLTPNKVVEMLIFKLTELLRLLALELFVEKKTMSESIVDIWLPTWLLLIIVLNTSTYSAERKLLGGG